jgi:hypothetical protein
VDIDDKKKDRFMVGLSTKLQERMAINTGGSFPEFVSNVIITDDAILGCKEEEGHNSSIWQCSSQVPDGVPPRPHLPASLAAAAPASAARLGFQPTSAPASAISI